MADDRKPRRAGWRNPASASNGKAGGRPARGTRLETGDQLLVSHVTPDGTVDLGRGTVAVEGTARTRMIVVTLPDGTELRLLALR